MKKILIFLCACTFLLGCDSKGSEEKEESWFGEAKDIDPDGEPITFLTYNLFHIYTINDLEKFPVADASRAERVDLLIKEIKGFGSRAPTFILLQEAFHNETRAKIVDELSEMYGTINHNRANTNSGTKFGSGLVTLYHKDRATPIPGGALFEEFSIAVSELPEIQYATKGVLAARFEVSDLKIEVFNTHLSSIDSTGNTRERQAKYIKKMMARRQAEKPMDSQILGGDLNTDKYDEDGEIQAPLEALLDGSVEGFAMLDMVSDKAKFGDMATWNPRNPLVELSKWPLSRAEVLDYFYVNPGEEERCQPDKKASQLFFTSLYPLKTLTPLVIGREAIRKKAMDTLKNYALDEDAFKKYRIKGPQTTATTVWIWDEDQTGAADYPPKDVRDAIDRFLVFTPVKDVDFSDLNQLEFKFQKDAAGVPLAPLSDHYGVWAAVVCSGVRGALP